MTILPENRTYTIENVHWDNPGDITAIDEYLLSRKARTLGKYTPEYSSIEDIEYLEDGVVVIESYPWLVDKHYLVPTVKKEQVVQNLDIELYPQAMKAILADAEWLQGKDADERERIRQATTLNFLYYIFSFSDVKTVENLLLSHYYIIDDFLAVDPQDAPRAILPQLFLTIESIRTVGSSKAWIFTKNAYDILWQKAVEGFERYAAHMAALLIIAEGYAESVSTENLAAVQKANALYTTILAEQLYGNEHWVKKILFVARDSFNNFWYTDPLGKDLYYELLDEDFGTLAFVSDISPKLGEVARKLYDLS